MRSSFTLDIVRVLWLVGAAAVCVFLWLLALDAVIWVQDKLKLCKPWCPTQAGLDIAQWLRNKWGK
jgi:hypothetical protein